LAVAVGVGQDERTLLQQLNLVVGQEQAAAF
jgi:hypothetical protein